MNPKLRLFLRGVMFVLISPFILFCLVMASPYLLVVGMAELFNWIVTFTFGIEKEDTPRA